MIKRCELKTHKEYKDYGGRGIKVCDEWRSNFQSFYDWSMSNGYEDGLNVERVVETRRHIHTIRNDIKKISLWMECKRYFI